MLDDRKPEPGTARGPRPVATIEAFEQALKIFFRDAGPVIGCHECRPFLVLLHGEPERRPGARMPKCVLDQVLRDDVEHPGTERELRIGVACNLNRHVRPIGPLIVLGRDELELRQRFCRPECDDDPSALELGEKEHVVDQFAHLLDFGTNLRQDRGGV